MTWPVEGRRLTGADVKVVAKRVVAEIRGDHLTLLSGGIAFWGMVAVFPALLALITIYGLVADPVLVAEQIAAVASVLPGSADNPETLQGIIATAMRDAAAQDQGALTVSLFITIGGALWTASAGVAGLIEGVNAAYDEVDTRPYPKKRGLALLLTLGAIVFLSLAVSLIAVVPVVLRFVGLQGLGATLINLARWPVLAAMIMSSLAVIYRVGPDRDTPKTRWRSPGALVATMLFLLVSAGFSLYVTTFGGRDSYAATYGALAGVIVLLFWLFLSAFAILLGAEVNNELERLQRGADAGSTRIGRRDPYLADTGPG